MSEPSISTADGKIMYAGADHTFIRRRRDTVSLFDMSDAVTAYGSKLDAMASDRTADLAAQGKLNAAAKLATEKVAKDVNTLTTTATKMTAQLDALVAAASSGEDAACTPGVEYQSGTDKSTKKAICKYLTQPCNTFATYPMYEKQAASRTSDRVCAPYSRLPEEQYVAVAGTAFKDNVFKKLTVCTKGKQYQSTPPTSTSDRKCSTITDCKKAGKIVATPATATTDAECAILGQTKDNAARDCVEIKQKLSKLPSGYFYVKDVNQNVRKVWCDQVHKGGGWMLMGHMQAKDKTCWGSSSDCNTGRSQSDSTRLKQTWRHGDAFMNGFKYYTIRQQGTGSLKGDNYWMGKDSSPGCRYNHNAMSTSTCKRSYKTVSTKLGGQPSFGSGCQGSNHGCHRGVGDWPCYNGEVTSNHCHGGGGSGRGWYYHSASTGGSRGSGQCTSTSSGCNSDFWIR